MGRCRGYTVQCGLMQFLVLIVVEDQFTQFDFDGFAHWLFAHIHRLKLPLAILHPAVAELLPIKAFLGLHGFRLSCGPVLVSSLAYYSDDTSVFRREETVR